MFDRTTWIDRLLLVGLAIAVPIVLMVGIDVAADFVHRVWGWLA